MNSENKERNLKTRLDALEEQVLALHGVLARKKQQAALLNKENNQQENAVKIGQRNVTSRPANQLKLVQSRYRKTSERKLFCNDELYEYLANITKHIANGSNAVSKLASLSQLHETPTIKTILFPREYFYGVAPELRTLDANFTLGPSQSRNPLSRLVQRHNQCSCCKNVESPRKGILEGETVKSISNRTRTSSCISSKSSRYKCAKCDYLEKQVTEEDIVVRSRLEKQISNLKNELKSKTDNFMKKMEDLEVKLLKEQDLRIVAEKTLSGMEKEMEHMAKKMRKSVESKRRTSSVNQITQKDAVESDGIEVDNGGNGKGLTVEMSEQKDKKYENGKKDKAVSVNLIEDSYMTTNMAEQKEQLEKALTFLQNQLELERHTLREYKEKARFAEKAYKELKIRMFKAEEAHAREIKRLIESNNDLLASVTQIRLKSTSQIQEQSKFDRSTTTFDVEQSAIQIQQPPKVEDSSVNVAVQSDSKITNEVINETKLPEDNLKKTLEEQKYQIKSLEKELNETKEKLKQSEYANNELKRELNESKDNLKQLDANNELQIELNETKDKLKQSEDLNNELKKELNEINDKLKQSEELNNEFKSKVCKQETDIETLKNEICTNKDTISIKDAMLNDQLDTINTLKEASENSKVQLHKEIEKQQKSETDILHLNQENAELKARIVELEACAIKAEKYRKNQAKNLSILKKLEEMIDEKQKQWQHQVASISNERDEAVKTARFASKKLLQAVNEYESKIKAQKQCADLLRISLKEKETKLEVANQQIEILNTQVWKSTQISQSVNNDLRCKLKKACEVYTDLLEDCCATNSEGGGVNVC